MDKNTVSMVVAYDQNRGIGYEGGLPWGNELKQDLAMFKQLTRGESVIMGSRTFETMGAALPHRENIVISRSGGSFEGAISVSGIAGALRMAAHRPFIIGGGHIYGLALPYTDRIYATEVEASLPADTFFPEIDMNEWREVSRVEKKRSDTGDPYDYDFVIYDRTTTALAD